MFYKLAPALTLAIVFLATSTNLSATSEEKVVRLSEPVFVDKTSETFGSALDMSLDLVNLKELVKNAESYEDKTFRLETKIAKVCQKKGCFFIAQQDETVVRVAFKDYGFFIPSDSSNKTVMLSGALVKKELSEAQAAHFTEDLNDKTASIKSGPTYEIVADSVRIPLS